jgi:hypothetical protein
LHSQFDAWLKAKDTTYGIRNLEDVVAEANKHDLVLHDVMEMPANNLCVVLQKQ